MRVIIGKWLTICEVNITKHVPLACREDVTMYGAVQEAGLGLYVSGVYTLWGFSIASESISRGSQMRDPRENHSLNLYIFIGV